VTTPRSLCEPAWLAERMVEDQERALQPLWAEDAES
jgi:hypothetical protein